MQFSTLLAAICVFVASAYSAVQLDGELFEVSNVTVNRVISGNFSIAFTIHDPDPLTNATSECSGSWAYGSKGYPQSSYKICGNSTFGWNMDSFTGFNRFTLGLQHRFSDPSIGEPPYDGVITYGRAGITKKNLQCETSGESVSCSQKPAIIEAPIYAVSA